MRHMKFVITMPIYEDWDSAVLVCENLSTELTRVPDIQATILLVDDGSISDEGVRLQAISKPPIKDVWVLRLRRNLGHQRAIAVALAYIHENLACDGVIVMDADGEDCPADVPRLIEAFRNAPAPTTIFVARGRRVESFVFKAFYVLYRFFHFWVTGRRIQFGNFSLMPAGHIASIVAYPELWNHYAAAVLKSRLPYSTIRADRGYRLRGRSRMNFVSLVVHGLSALFASYEVVSTRLLVATGIMALTTLAMIVIVASVRLVAHIAVPGWAPLVGGLLLLITIQLLATALTIIFSVMMNRNMLGFLPLRDYSYFVKDCHRIGLSESVCGVVADRHGLTASGCPND